MLKKISLLSFVLFLYAFSFAQNTVIQINYIDELAKIGEENDYPLSGNYILLRDLDFNNPDHYLNPTLLPTYTSGLGWLGIPRFDKAVLNQIYFTGTFNGNNHIIKNLYITGTSGYNIYSRGLFSIGANCTIKNLGMVNINIANIQSAGGLVSGLQANAEIDNCFVTGKIYSNSAVATIGGLVSSVVNTGIGFNVKITNCYTNVILGGTYLNAGSLVGIINKNPTGNTIIKNCYATGSIEVLNNAIYGFVGNLYTSAIGTMRDTITNCYTTAKRFNIISNNTGYAANFIGYVNNNGNISNLGINIKGCFGLSNDLRLLNFNSSQTNTTFSISDTVITGSVNRNFSPIITPVYSNTYLYNATNQQYPLLRKTDGTLMDGQRAVYPSNITKNTNSFNGYAGNVSPIDNFTKVGITQYTIVSINGVAGSNSYISVNQNNGTLSWVESIPHGNYLIEIYAANGAETNTSWVQLEIIKPNNALTNVIAQSVRFTTSDTSFANSDFIVIDSLNLINRNYTIETWAKLEGSINSWKRIFDFARGANPSGILLGFPLANKLGYHANGGDRIISFPAGFNPRAWNHYALTLKDTLLSLYINGALVDSYRGNKSTIGYNKNYLGKSNYRDSSTAGRFSECRIWLKAKPADEIRAYYNQLLPTNTDSLYVYLPLSANIYGSLPIISNNLANSRTNYGGYIPTASFHRKSNLSMNYIYDSSQQYVHGTLNTFLEPGETIQIAVKDSTTNWLDVTHVSGYLFSYKLPENFISGNIYVHSLIDGVKTNRFGNNYAASKYYVDWVGTNLRLNPNIPFKEITGYSKDILLQRNNTNNPYTVINPLIANTTDAPQYTVVNDPPGIIYYNTTPTITSRPKNTYLSDLNVVFLYTLSGDTSIALNTLNYVNVPERNNDLNLVNTIGNSIITLNSKAPSGRYTFDAKLINSLNAPSVDNDNYGVKTFSIILADSLKAVNYAAQNYVKTAFKAINSGSPVIIGNDGSVRAIRYQMLVRRNGIDITNLYAFNAANLDVSTSNRPVGVDSVFLTYTGWFNEEVKDTLIFSFVYTKPSIKYTPNESNDFSLINARANFTPIVLDSGGKTLTYSFLTANANFTISPQTGKITVVNWENLAAGNSAELKIVASNGTYLDTAIFTYTKTLQDRVLYFSNSSYRTQSTNGGDYIQLPVIDLRNKAFGMDVWYKHNAKTGVWHRIIDIGTGANNQGVLIALPDTMQLFVRTPNQTDYYLSIPAWVNIRSWNHYVVSVSSTGEASFFINGRFIFRRSDGGTTPQTIFTSNFLGKSNYFQTDAPSEGQFTDFRIWDNTIDSTVYNTRGITYFTANTGANLIFYLPLSVPVFNSNLPLSNNYRLVNKAAIGSTAILDSVAYIKGNSNSFNFDADRIFIAGQSTLSNPAKTVSLIINNYASAADTSTVNQIQLSNTAIVNKYYWGGVLSPNQGAYLNNQLINIYDVVTGGASVTYPYLVKYLPNYTTYLPGDSIQVFTSKAGYVFPRNDFWVPTQKPTKYTLIDSGGLNNVINFEIDSVTGKFSWLPLTETVEAQYPIKINVTNEVGTITINCKVLLSDSLRSIQYSLDSLSVNYGTDSTNIPFTGGITPSTRFSVTSIPNNIGIKINPLNGRIYWNSNVNAGLYTLTVQASNYINTITKTIKLNIKLLAPRGLKYQQNNFTIVNTGFDTATTYINKPIINTGGGVQFTSENTPDGCSLDNNTGAIQCANNLVTAGNYSMVVKAENALGVIKDTIYIKVIITSKDSIVGYKNAYFTLNTDGSYKYGDYIALPSVYLPNNFSIEAWVKLKDITRNYQQIFDAGNADNNHMVSIGTAGTTGRLFISIPTAANGNASNDIWDTQVTPRIANNTWFHIVYVKKGVNVKLYLNGTKVIEDNTSVISYNDSITRVYFGATNFGNQSMLGQLDECRIWKKALTEAEIARYKTVFLTPQDDSLYVYLPLHGSLIKDTSIPAGTIIKNSATGASALTRPITVGGNGMKMSRDPNRQIVYGTHDTTTTLTNPINVVTHFYNQPITSDSNTTAVKFGNHWATENKKIPSIFVLGTIQVNKTGTVFNPDPLYVYYAPTAITYNYLNTFNIPQSTTPYTTNKPLVYTNYDSTNLVFSISPAYTGISIDATTGIITIDADMVYSAHGKHVKPTIIAQSGLGSTSTEVTINIIPTNIIGYNNTSVCLPQTNGQDYIRIPSLDLSNSNFAIDIWFKLIGSPTGNKRIFDFSRAAANQGLILFFSLNKLKLGAFEQDTLINLGNADTVLKNGVNEWNKYSIFYNATTKTYYVYINGVLKKMATAATDKYIIPLLSNFLANNNYLDPVTDGYFREFKIYKNISYTDFIKNLSYNILPNRPDNSLYYYLPLSNNVNNSTYNGNITINNNTELTNKALMYNPNAPNTNAVISTANNRAFYYGDSINQIITGEFIDQANRIRFSYTNGEIKDTILPNEATEKYNWQIKGKNIFGKFTVYNSLLPQQVDSINIIVLPRNLNYANNNQVYPVLAGNSSTPTFAGTEVQFSLDTNNATGFAINANTGVISWGNTIPAGLYRLTVNLRNALGATNFTYIVNLQDTLQGFSYTPDSVIASGLNADSLPFLPSFTKGTGAVFSILNPTDGFSINANNGKIYWTNTVANGVYKIRVRVNNVYNLPLTDTVTIILTTQAPSNLKYLQDTMAFSQGVYLQTPKPSINRGGLRTIFTISNITPSGANIRIDSLTGEIKWASNTVGTYTITVVATNSLGNVSKTIHITIIGTTNIALDYNNASLILGYQIANFSVPNKVVLPNLDLRGEGYTIETWARALGTLGVGNWRRIIDFGTGQNYDGVILGFQAETKFGVHASNLVDHLYNFPLNFNALNWNHYAITVSDSLRFYVNGVLLGTGVANKPSVIFNKNYLNFSNWVGDAAGLNAYQECRIWKYARSGAEIAQNYQGSVPNDAIGLYYYLPFKQTGYLPGSIVNPTNFVLAPEEGYNGAGNFYKTYIANAAVNSSLTDSSKILAVVGLIFVPNLNNKLIVKEEIVHYKIDSTRQKIQGNYAGTLAAGEVLQYSIDTGRTWKNIGFVQGNNWSQTIDTGFKYGLIKIRSIINNVATNRQFNDIDVVVYPNPPTNIRATPINDGTVTLQFTPPVIKSNITGYKIYTSAGVLVATATQSPVLIEGLINGQSYQFKVSTINSKGESQFSTLSNTVNVVNTILQVTTFTNTIAGVNITPTTIVAAYSDFRVTYQIKTGYKLDSIYVDNVRNRDSIYGSVTFLNINGGHSVKVYASKIPFTLTITKNSGGVVSPNQSTITTYYGDTLVVQFIPDNRYKVDSVFINGMYNADVKSSYTFTNIQENNTVRVVFKAIVYKKITLEIVGNGTATAPVGEIEVEQGTTYRLGYMAAIGNLLDSVLVDGVLKNDSVHGYTFNTISSDVKIRLVFKIKTFTITAIVKNGSVTPSGTITYNYGTNVRYNFSPINNLYVLDSLLIDGELQVNPDTTSYNFVSLDTSHTIQIIFSLKANVKYTVYIYKTVGVLVTPSTNQQVGYGGKLQITWVANTGYILDSIFVNGVYNKDSINGYTFNNIRGVQSINIKYKLKTFTITSTAGIRGTINPLGISIVNYGASKSFVLTPNVGYETDSLYIDGNIVSMPSDNIYTFNNVTTNHTIYVTFKVITINPNPCTETKQTPNIVRVTDALKSDITTFATQRWYLAGTIKDSTTNNTYTPTDAGVYTLLGVDATGCESNISKKYYYSKSCITPAGRLGNGATIQTDIVGNANIMVIKWCTDLMQGEVRVQVLDISGEQIEDKKIPSSFGTYILNKQQIQSKKFIIRVMDNNGEIIQISDVVNN